MSVPPSPLTVFITSPLEAEFAARIAAVAPEAVRTIYEPDLLPPIRYVADHKGVEGFARDDVGERRWRDNLAAAHVLWDFPVPPAGQTLDRSRVPNLRWVQTTSSGVGQLVKNLGFDDTDLLVTTSRGVHAGPLAEFTAMALLIHFKDLAHLRAEKDRRAWARYCGDGLEGKTMAVIGAGRVGRRILAMGRAFGMRTVLLNRPGGTTTAADAGADLAYPAEALHAMLSETDALVLSMPHTPDTENLIDAAALAALKPGAVLVNVARGAVVDEPALVDALASGQVGFAALDVFAVEPLPAASPLWDLPNVLISPHSASTVARENELITALFCRNLERYLAGRIDEMENVLDKARLY